MKLNYLGAAVLCFSSSFYGCGKSSDHHTSSVQDSPTNIRRAIDDMIDDQATSTSPIEVVVGLPMDFAQELAENYAAHFIRTRLNDELKAKYGSYRPVERKYDFEVNDAFDKHRIFVGFEWSNKHVAALRNSFLERQYKSIPLDTGRIEGYVVGNKFIVVTGDKPGNVMAAGFALSEFNHTLNNGQPNDLNCSIANVTDYYPDVSITVEKP